VPGRAGDTQLLVENYFAATTTLPAADYWIGIMRANSTDPYMYTGGQLVSTIVGNANPYAHW
jgi:hypothetical protein